MVLHVLAGDASVYRSWPYLCGLVLSLPLPIPFSNSIPAMAILLLCLGAIVEDGVMVLLGHGVGLGAWGYLYAVGDVTWSIIHKIISLE